MKLRLLCFGISAAIFVFAAGLPRATPPKSEAMKPLPLCGEEAIKQLKEEGSFDSLAEAMMAATYSISPSMRAPDAFKTETYEASNSRQALQTSFTGEEVHVASRGIQKWEIGLKLKEYGYGTDLVSLESGEIEAQGDRIEISKHSVQGADFRRDMLRHVLDERKLVPPRLRSTALTEWYVNTPNGLEQGFTLASPPESCSHGPAPALSEANVSPCYVNPNAPTERGGDSTNGYAMAHNRLRIALEVTGDLTSEATEDGKAILLKDQRGQVVAHYDHLKAWDATGRELASQMRANGRELSLEVEDAGAIYPVTIDPTLYQEVRLTAEGGAATDLFGWSVAISGNTAIVGALNRGAAYIFVRNAETWSLQKTLKGLGFGKSVAISGNTAIVGGVGAAYVNVRTGTEWLQGDITILTPNDLAAGDHFADSVAISGDTAIIGAPFKDNRHGAAYIFTRSGQTWSQQKLNVVDRNPVPMAQAGDGFGYSVAINGDTAIIGAPADNTMGDSSSEGSAYVYVRGSGMWTEQAWLTSGQTSGGEGPEFGYAVGISGDKAIIGTLSDQAFVFERTGATWSAPQPLLPNDGENLTSDRYGEAVAISGNLAVVGANAEFFSPNNPRPGAAYLFRRGIAGWVEQQRLAASDAPAPNPAPPAGDGQIEFSFGWSVAISGDTVLVGAPRKKVVSNRFQGGAYIFHLPDTDGDGLPDAWELNGITVDTAGLVLGDGNLASQGTFINLPAMGANPMHKDLFVHADWMAPDPTRPSVVFKPSARAIKMVIDAFAAAPADQVKNPDGKPGISLHVDLGPESMMKPHATWGALSQAGQVPFQSTTGSNFPDGEYNWSVVDTIKGIFFAPTRRAVFHYALFCNNYPSNPPRSSGLSRELPGADFLVALGQINNGTLQQQAGTFMHEFGHNLALRHGGNSEVNNKPNYLSIMNYTFQMIGLVNSKGPLRSFDYSRATLDKLDERNALDENLGINDPAMHLTLWKCSGPSNSSGVPYYRRFLPSKALDWNLNLMRDTVLVGADINCDGTSSELTGFTDWPVLAFDGGGQIGNAAGASEPETMGTRADERPIEEILSFIPQELLDEETSAPLDVVTFSPEEGGAPLVVTFDGSASSAVNGTVVSWQWDFGDGTTGSGATVTHTYDTPGDYFASLTVTDSNGHVNLVPLRNLVTVTNGPSPTPTPIPTATPTPSNKPNLTPYKPPGWSDKLVVSNLKGTNTDSSPLAVTDTLYVDFAVINNGGAGISTTFVSKLFIDEVLVGTFNTNQPLNPSGYFYVEDFPIGQLRSGQHSIKIVADANGAIAEGDESDNEYIKVINIAGTGATPMTYTVKSTADSGPDTLRQAMTDANAHPNADSSTPDRIEFAIPGPGVQTIVLASRLPQITDAVVIDGYSQPGSSPNTLAVGNNAVQRIELNGNGANGVFGYAFQLQDPRSAGSTIRGLVINRYYFGGILILSDNNAVEGCFFDTNAAGDTRVVGSSQGGGITIYQGANNRIGGTTPAARNVIAGDYVGIVVGNDNLNGVANTLIQGNYIGTNAAGTAAVHKTDRDSSGVIIGGVKVTNTIIGGTQPGAGNVISGNGTTLGGYGILLGPAGDVTIQGNLIGTNAQGTAAIGNPTGGIRAVQAVTHLLIGGAASGARNIISGNGTFAPCPGLLCDVDAGISIVADTTNGVSIQGNYIGTGSDGITLVPNRIYGIEIRPVAGKSYIIGGTNPGEGNIIAGNARTSGLGGSGVLVSGFNSFSYPDGTVSILGNSIFANENLGIALTGCSGNSTYCVLTNDFGDADKGANGFQNYPVLGSVSFAGGNVTVEGTLNSAPNKTYRLEFFANNTPDPSRFGQGQFYLGFTSVTTDTVTTDQFGRVSGNAAFKVTFPAPAGARYASATATDPDGNTSEFSAVPGQALNISTRLRVQKGENVLIGGFIVTGTAPKNVILRAIGPSLGITGALADTTLELHDATGAVIAFNDNWKDTQQADIEGSGIPPSNDLESAIARTLTPGNYTAIVRGKNDTAGIGLVEGYDLSATPDSKVANISTRGFVDAGDNVMIGGFIIGPAATGLVGNILGGTTGDTKVLIRAIGPSLPVDGKLADPTLELHDRNGALIESNDNWVDSPNKQAIIDSTIPPANDLEAAIVRTLPPENYTAIVRGVNNTTGIALVEVYVLN